MPLKVKKGFFWFAGRFLLFAALAVLLGILINVSQTDMMKAAMLFAAVTGVITIVSFFTAKDPVTKAVSLILTAVFWGGFLIFALG